MSTVKEKETVVLETDSGIIAIALQIYGDQCEQMGGSQSHIDRIRNLEFSYRDKE